MAQADYTSPPGTPPFSQRTPSGVLSYVLQALEANGTLNPRETERLSVLDSWGARSVTAKGLHFSVLNDGDGCHIGTVDTSLPEEDQIPHAIYDGELPRTQAEANGLVAMIAIACA